MGLCLLAITCCVFAWRRGCRAWFWYFQGGGGRGRVATAATAAATAATAAAAAAAASAAVVLVGRIVRFCSLRLCGVVRLLCECNDYPLLFIILRFHSRGVAGHGRLFTTKKHVNK